MSVKPLDASSSPATATPTPRGLSRGAAEGAISNLASNGFDASALTAAAVQQQGAVAHVSVADLHRATMYLAATA